MWNRARVVLALRHAPTCEQVSCALEMIERDPWAPTHWGWMSDDRRPYAREAMLSWLFDQQRDLKGFEPTARRWNRPAYKMIFRRVREMRPECDVLLLPPASAGEIEAFYSLGESLASVLPVELGGISIDGWPDAAETYTGGTAINLSDVRSLGIEDLFPRTFFGPRLWEQVANAVEQGGMRDLANGVKAIDFVSEPWRKGPEQVEGPLMAARKLFADAGLSPSEDFDPGPSWEPIEEP